jgi:hypothetical protein
MSQGFLSDFALVGLGVGVLVCAAAVLLVVGRFRRACERDDDVARAASGMDEFSAPEGGRQHE